MGEQLCRNIDDVGIACCSLEKKRNMNTVYLFMYIYIDISLIAKDISPYIYIYMCVCVCVAQAVSRLGRGVWLACVRVVAA